MQMNVILEAEAVAINENTGEFSTVPRTDA